MALSSSVAYFPETAMYDTNINNIFKCVTCFAKLEASRRPSICKYCHKVNSYQFVAAAKVHTIPTRRPSGESSEDDEDEENEDDEAPADTSTLDNVKFEKSIRFETGFKSLDKLFGGGAVAGCSYMVSGQPGAGKSTLFLQLLAKISEIYREPVFYATAEEQTAAISERANRLGIKKKVLSRISVTENSDINYVCDEIIRLQPMICVLDSVQTFHDSTADGVAGFGNQPLRVLKQFREALKETKCLGIAVSQENKDNKMVGANALQHEVDATFQIKIEGPNKIRVITPLKNRGGSDMVIAKFMMTDTGLVETLTHDED